MRFVSKLDVTICNVPPSTVTQLKSYVRVCAGTENSTVVEVHKCGDNSVRRFNSGITDSDEKHRDELCAKFRLRVAGGENQRCVPDGLRHAYPSFTEEVSLPSRKMKIIN